MYANELLDAYKKAQNYIQDKQIAHDLHLTSQQLHKIRKGIRYVSDAEAIFLAEGAGIDPEIALLGCHADRNENPQIKAVWANIAKKYNGLGLSAISGAYAVFAVQTDGLLTRVNECVLCILC